MSKTLILFVLMVFVSACTNTQYTSTTDTGMKRPCCEKCECCKSGKCAKGCKDGKCSCCKNGSCKMCFGVGTSSTAEGEECPMCIQAEREWKAKQGTMEH